MTTWICARRTTTGSKASLEGEQLSTDSPTLPCGDVLPCMCARELAASETLFSFAPQVFDHPRTVNELAVQADILTASSFYDQMRAGAPPILETLPCLLSVALPLATGLPSCHARARAPMACASHV